MGEWQKVPTSNCGDRLHPCTNCGMGYGGVSSWVDPVTLELWTKSDDCTETCDRLKEYRSPEPRERLFGQNIRDAYHAIKGS